MKKLWIVLMALMGVGMAHAEKETVVLTTGGNMEGENTCVLLRPNSGATPNYATPEQGKGKDGSKGVYLEAPAGAENDWGVAMFIEFNEPIYEGDVFTEDEYVMYIPPLTFTPGEEVEMPIMLKNTGDVKHFYATISLPEGFTYELDENNQPTYTLNQNRWEEGSASIPCWVFSGNEGLTISYDSEYPSTYPYPLKKEDGIVATLRIKVDPSVQPGTYEAQLKNINFNHTSILQPDYKTTFTVTNPGEYVMYIPPLTFTPGDEVEMPIMLKNTGDVKHFFATISLPEGFTYELDENNQPAYTLNQNRWEEGSANIPCWVFSGSEGLTISYDSEFPSTYPYPLKKEDGIVATLRIKVDPSVQPGTYEAQLKNINFNHTSILQPDYKTTFTVTNPGEYVMYIPPLTFTPGEEVEMPIMLKNTGDVKHFFATISLPEGFTYELEENNQPAYTLNQNRWEEGSANIPCWVFSGSEGLTISYDSEYPSPYPYPLKKEDGIVATLRVKVDPSVQPGTYEAQLKNINFNHTSILQPDYKTTFTVTNPWTGSHIQGDVDGDGKVTVADISKLIEILLHQK